jgi:two-component system chemotaxis sensor kinase CheA
MDVVRRSIEALRGTLDIDSQAGQGTVFRIRLPLTLAIIDGFLMAVGEAHYVVPLDAVLECVQLGAEARDYVNLRGEVPLLRLRAFRPAGPGGAARTWWWCSSARARPAWWWTAQGEFQAVISRSGPMEGLPGIGLDHPGQRRMALMLDMPTLVNQASWGASQEARSCFQPIDSRSFLC